MEDFETSDVTSENQQLSKKERRELRRQERKVSAHQKGGTKRMFIWVGVFAAIGLVVYGIFLGVSKNIENQPTPQSVDAITDGDWVHGNKDAKVVVIEYADFQCPACKSYYPVVKALAEEFPDTDVAFVLRHFPLRSIHMNAEQSSRAAQAAGLQGKFWEMHDMLFMRQDDWSKIRDPRETFVAYAGEIGLDIEKFKTDIDSDAVKDAVERDFSGGISAKVNSTPSFFINGKYISNPASIDAFRALITDALNTSS